MNGYYLHFRHTPSQAVLEHLISIGSTVEQVFDTSYDITSPLSMSEMKHLLRSMEITDYALIKVKSYFISSAE